MKTRATTSSTRSKDWCQLHTLVHASILRKYGRTGLLHVSVKLRRLQECAARSGTCAIGTSALTWWGSLSLSFALLTLLHLPPSFEPYPTHLIHQYGHLC